MLPRTTPRQIVEQGPGGRLPAYRNRDPATFQGGVPGGAPGRSMCSVLLTLLRRPALSRPLPLTLLRRPALSRLRAPGGRPGGAMGENRKPDYRQAS